MHKAGNFTYFIFCSSQTGLQHPSKTEIPYETVGFHCSFYTNDQHEFKLFHFFCKTSIKRRKKKKKIPLLIKVCKDCSKQKCAFL